MPAEPSPTPDRSDKQRHPTGRRTSDLYAAVTQQIIEMLEKGVVPWRSPILGRGTAGYPKNLNTGKAYRGVNVFLLAVIAQVKGFESAYWLTFRQAQERGGTVKKGEKASMVVFFKPYEVDGDEPGEKKQVFVLRYFKVFNVNQCDGIAVPDAPKYTPSEFRPIDAAARVVTGYRDGPTIQHGGSQAFYRPSADTVAIPEPTRFVTTEEYYGTLFHELGHSTGHSKRLDRGLDRDLRPFGSPDYGKEELVAEMTAAFLCAEVGIQPAVIENSTAYISGWLAQLKKDSKLVIAAASAAQRAAEWIRGLRERDVPGGESISDSGTNGTAEIDAIE